MFYLLPFGVGLLLTLIFTPLVKKLAIKLNIVDQPSPRKIHVQPVPLLGGTAIFFSFALTTLLFLFLGYVTDVKISATQIYAILTAGLILIFGGYLDDKFNLKPTRQFIFPLIAIFIVLLGGLKIQFITNPFGGVLEFSTTVGIILAGLWLLGMIYTTKFLDGLDGLVSGITTISAIIIFIVSLYWDVPSSGTSTLALILAGCTLGFLYFNWHPAKIFLGEGGSVFCGFILGVLAIISGSKIATALLIMGIPILDVLWVIVRRLWQNQSPTSPDRKHLHFRLLDIGMSQRQAVLFLYFITGIFGLASLFLHTKGKILALAILITIMIMLAIGLVAIYKSKRKNENIVNPNN